MTASTGREGGGRFSDQLPDVHINAGTCPITLCQNLCPVTSQSPVSSQENINDVTFVTSLCKDPVCDSPESKPDLMLKCFTYMCHRSDTIVVSTFPNILRFTLNLKHSFNVGVTLLLHSNPPPSRPPPLNTIPSAFYFALSASRCPVEVIKCHKQ